MKIFWPLRKNCIILNCFKENFSTPLKKNVQFVHPPSRRSSKNVDPPHLSTMLLLGSQWPIPNVLSSPLFTTWFYPSLHFTRTITKWWWWASEFIEISSQIYDNACYTIERKWKRWKNLKIFVNMSPNSLLRLWTCFYHICLSGRTITIWRSCHIFGTYKRQTSAFF